MNGMDRIDSVDNPEQWEVEAAFEQKMTLAQQMKHYFPDKTAVEIAASNLYDLLFEIAIKRRDEEGDHEEHNGEKDWEIMWAIWNYANEMVEEALG